MLEQAKVKTLPVLNRAVDYAPAAQVCCGVCRTCATTNILTVATAGVMAAVAYSERLTRRVRRRRASPVGDSPTAPAE